MTDETQRPYLKVTITIEELKDEGKVWEWVFNKLAPASDEDIHMEVTTERDEVPGLIAMRVVPGSAIHFLDFHFDHVKMLRTGESEQLYTLSEKEREAS